MLKMLRSEIALNVASGINRPQTPEELISSALITEHYLNSIKTNNLQQKPASSENKNSGNSGGQRYQGNQRNWRGSNNSNKRKHWDQKTSGGNSKGGSTNKQIKYPMCSKCGKTHFGVCRQGTRECYVCGLDEHMTRSCPTRANQPQQQSNPYGGGPAQLHQMQTALEGPHINQGRLEAPSVTTNARVFAITKEEAANASTVVTVLDMHDYDVIMGMDFLSKYGASIECRKRKVVFQPEAESRFEFVGEPKEKTKKFLSA
ncbi:uncharacterized protein LOC141845970 [Curcuma longa]|uniref:uncharacterized protein LOC141845970 n=1 Tax=Curcuma longa TaxID=136217 RepID=UPI003D9EC0F5